MRYPCPSCDLKIDPERADVTITDRRGRIWCLSCAEIALGNMHPRKSAHCACATCNGSGRIEWSIPDADGDTHGRPCPDCPAADSSPLHPPTIALVPKPSAWRWWGTCVDCPRDERGVAHSWQCMNRDRGDHRLER